MVYSNSRFKVNKFQTWCTEVLHKLTMLIAYALAIILFDNSLTPTQCLATAEAFLPLRKYPRPPLCMGNCKKCADNGNYLPFRPVYCNYILLLQAVTVPLSCAISSSSNPQCFARLERKSFGLIIVNTGEERDMKKHSDQWFKFINCCSNHGHSLRVK